jgi:hypothetical protein
VRDRLDGAGLSGYLVYLVYLVGGEVGETSGLARQARRGRFVRSVDLCRSFRCPSQTNQRNQIQSRMAAPAPYLAVIYMRTTLEGEPHVDLS